MNYNLGKEKLREAMNHAASGAPLHLGDVFTLATAVDYTLDNFDDFLEWELNK